MAFGKLRLKWLHGHFWGLFLKKPNLNSLKLLYNIEEVAMNPNKVCTDLRRQIGELMSPYSISSAKTIGELTEMLAGYLNIDCNKVPVGTTLRLIDEKMSEMAGATTQANPNVVVSSSCDYTAADKLMEGLNNEWIKATDFVTQVKSTNEIQDEVLRGYLFASARSFDCTPCCRIHTENLDDDLVRLGQLFVAAINFRVCIKDVREMLANYGRPEIAKYTRRMFSMLDDLCVVVGYERYRPKTQ